MKWHFQQKYISIVVNIQFNCRCRTQNVHLSKWQMVTYARARIDQMELINLRRNET